MIVGHNVILHKLYNILYNSSEDKFERGYGIVSVVKSLSGRNVQKVKNSVLLTIYGKIFMHFKYTDSRGECDTVLGGLGQFEAMYIMSLAMTHAGKLGKFGA